MRILVEMGEVWTLSTSNYDLKHRFSVFKKIYQLIHIGIY